MAKLHEVSKDGLTFKYSLENDTVTVHDPSGSGRTATFPLTRSSDGMLKWVPGSPEYNNCVSGCYSMAHGSPAELAYCLGLCCFG